MISDKMSEHNNKGTVIVFCNSGFEFYCFRREIVEMLIAEGFKVVVCCLYGKKIDLLKDEGFIFENAKIDRRGVSVIRDLALKKQYDGLIKKYRPSLVLTFTTKPNVYASLAAKKYKVPYINNVTGLGSSLKNSFLKKIVFFLLKRAFKKSRCVMFQNSYNLQIAEENKLVKGKVRLLPGSGVNCERFPVLPYPDGGNGVDGAPVVFNYIGRVLNEKGVDDYIAAAIIIKKEYPNVIFNVIGPVERTESHYIEELNALQKDGVIRYFEEQDDIKPFVERAHATILPSVYGEGMSNALLESAAMGRVLITTNNPGCRETVINDVTGYIFKGRDVFGLVEKIKIFLALDNETRKQMGLDGRKHVEKNFDRKTVVNAYKEEIEAVING